MIERFGMQRAHQRDVVGTTADVRQQFAELDARLAELAELERRAFSRAVSFFTNAKLSVLQQRFWNRLAVEFRKLRLGIEQIDVAGPAPHEKENAIRRLGGENAWCAAQADSLLSQDRRRAALRWPTSWPSAMPPSPRMPPESRSRRLSRFGSARWIIVYSLVTVSSRFKIVRATTTHAAASAKLGDSRIDLR